MADPAITQEVEIANRESIKVAEVTGKIKIRKDEDMKEATAQIVSIKKLYRNIDAKRKAITGPMRQAIKETDELFKDPLGRLKGQEDIIKAEMIRYTESVERRAANRADKIEGQVDSGELGMGEAMGKLGGIKQADTNVKTDEGSTQIKTVTRIRIINVADLPQKYLLRPRVLEALRMEVEEDVKRKGEQCPPGAEQYQDKQVAIRS